MTMHNDTIEAHAATEKVFELLIKYMEMSNSRLKDLRWENLETLTDELYATREMEKVVKEMVSRLRKRRDFLEKAICLIWQKDSPDGEPIRTDYCTATPKPTVTPKLPTYKNDPDAYIRLMQYFGVSYDAAKAEVLRPHWPAFVEFFADILAEGKPIPEGIDPSVMYPVFNVTVKSKKGIQQ